MTSTNTIPRDADATVTLEEESPRETMPCPMCAAAAASERAFLTICAQCEDDAADCSTCAPPAAVIGEAPAKPEAPGDLTQGWYIAFRDTAAEMWDFR